MAGGELEAATWLPSMQLESSKLWPRSAARVRRAAATIRVDGAPIGSAELHAAMACGDGAPGGFGRGAKEQNREYEKLHRQSREGEGMVAGDRRTRWWR